MPSSSPSRVSVSQLKPRLLLGPGPSPVSGRVLRALAHPTLGHLDPQFLTLLDDVSLRLRGIFGTGNEATLAVSGTGSAGMQAALANLLQPGDTAIVGIHGYFGGRMAEMARRLGAGVVAVEAEWGRVLEPERLIDAHRAHPRARLLSVVHAETSTGVRQPIREVGAYLSGTETLFVVDAVTSLGGIPVGVDAVGIDVCYSATQKCLGAPPGLAPISLSSRAVDVVRRRKVPVSSWYLDVGLLMDYLGAGHVYHHTASSNLFFALHEALQEIEEEGLEARHDRHRRVGARLRLELGARGFTLFGDPGHQLPELTSVRLPDGADAVRLRHALLERYGIEVGGGLGPTGASVWRIGLMGNGASEASVERLVGAVDELGIGSV
ncbi:MAG: alanine--glyoxylate aminotransferase family protein [Gammaproteobacteria bacterium]|nr:alanine--glyoxylate aminotransferase family protein [Gammaproteobacteria bacterium]